MSYLGAYIHDQVLTYARAVDEATQAHYIRIYRLIAEKISSFRSDVNKFIHKPADIDTLCQYVSTFIYGHYVLIPMPTLDECFTQCCPIR